MTAFESFSSWVYDYTCKDYISQPYTITSLLKQSKTFSDMLICYIDEVYHKKNIFAQVSVIENKDNDFTTILLGAIDTSKLGGADVDAVEKLWVTDTVTFGNANTPEFIKDSVDKSIHDLMTLI